MARAGKYRMELVKKEEKPHMFFFRGLDVESGSEVKIEVWQNGHKVLQGKTDEDVVKFFQSNNLCFSYQLGSFVGCYNFNDKCLHTYGGSRQDSLYVASDTALTLVPRMKFLADVLSFDGIPTVKIHSCVQACVVAFVNCSKVDIEPTGGLFCDGFFVSDATVNNAGKINCGSLFGYGEHCISGGGRQTVHPTSVSKSVFSLDGLDDPFEENGFFSSDDASWTQYVDNVTLPVRGTDKGSYEIGCDGKYYFVLVCKVKDGCCAKYDKDACFFLKDASGKILGKSKADIRANRWNFIVCPLSVTVKRGNVMFGFVGVKDSNDYLKIGFQDVLSVFIFKAC